MELCTSRAISNLPHYRFFSSKSNQILSKTSIPLKKTTISHRNPGFLYFATPLLGATTSEETSTSASKQFEEEPDGVITTEETLVDEKDVTKVVSTEVPKEEAPMGEQTQAFDFLDVTKLVSTEETLVDEKDVTKVVSTEVPKEEAPMGEQTQAFDFLDELNIQLDLEDPYPILLYGSGALVTLWLASAIVGTIDSIPVFPKVMEIVGLSFTIWFSYRYLIFKENRNELSAKIEEFKQQVLGSTDD